MSDATIRVLMVLSSLPTGGAERSALAVIRRMREVDINPLLVTINRRRDGELAVAVQQEGIRRLDVGGARMVDPLAWMRLREIVRRENVDVVHAHDQDAALYASIACVGGPPVVMTRHLVYERELSWRDAVRDRMVRLAARSCAARIAVSGAVQRSFSVQARVPEDHIDVLHNGVDTDVFHPITNPHEVRRRLGWESDRPILTMIGVLRPGKGHDVLLQALPRVLRSAPDVRVKVIGTGPEEDQLRRRARALDLPVEFLGERSDVATLMAASTVVVLPSWQEALPTVLIEAGACGVAVVATDVGGVGEIVCDGYTGLLSPAGNADAFADRVVDLLDDDVRRRAMGDRAVQLVADRFSLHRHLRELRRLYERVIHDGAPAAAPPFSRTRAR